VRTPSTSRTRSWIVAGSDISADALKKAAENSRLHKADVGFVRGDIVSCFADACADIVVANLPYISEKEFEKLPDEVRLFEPKQALLSGENGLGHIRQIVSDAPRVMRAGGYCILEVGDGQARICAEMFERNGFSASTAPDIYGKTRAVIGHWKK